MNIMKVSAPGLTSLGTTALIRNGSFFGTNEAKRADFGPVRRYLKKEAVRRVDPSEPVDCGESGTAHPGEAFVAIPVNSDGTEGSPRSVRSDYWDGIYMPHPESEGLWLPRGERRVVQVPEGVTAILITADQGEDNTPLVQVVFYPDYVAIGARNEVYSNSETFVLEKLVPIID